MKRIATILLCCAAVAALTLQPADAEPTLGIGSDAPPLDIAHYFHENDPKVTKFKSGQVYVVEFWATWCPPCVASMPHLAELQTKYRDKGVQIVSISDESVEEIQAIFERPHPQAKATYAEVTASYTLTTDPDGSSQRDYMEASNQQGIPTSFIVGKTGVIEWIGHPMELDDPLAKVIDDSWDREAYVKEMEAQAAREKMLQETLQEIDQLAGSGKFKEAIAALESRIAKLEDKELKERLVEIQQIVTPQFNFLAGTPTEEDYAFFRTERKAAEGNPQALFRHGMMVYNMVQNGADVGPLAGEMVQALEKGMDDLDADGKSAFYQLIARFHAAQDQLDKAIATIEKALEAGGTDLSRSQRQRLILLRNDWKSQVDKADGEKADSENADGASSEK